MSMLRHYFKLAIRNLLKYKSQSVISIVGLAVGFTCFALATLWIRYEQTYDTFHDGADRIYLVRVASAMYNDDISQITPYPLAAFMKETFPEIETACNMQAWNCQFKHKGSQYNSFGIGVDSATMKMFRFDVISGNRNFMLPDNKEIAITDKLASQLFGKEDPIGKELDMHGNRKICAIVKPWDVHSNMPFEILMANAYEQEWNMSSWQTFIKIRKGVDIEGFRKKLKEFKADKYPYFSISQTELTPITAMRYDRPNREVTVKYEHILLFVSAGGLVILCALFNYLTLFITRIRMRNREIALRKVCGSSDSNQLVLFAVEYMLTLVLALFTGLIMIELALPTFKELSEIKLENTAIYMEAVKYSGLIVILSFLLSLYPIYYFRRQTLNVMLKGSTAGRNKNTFQKISMVAQFIISICFIFCAFILMKQIHYLNQADYGLERTNRANVNVYPVIGGLKEEISKIPFVTEVFPDTLPPLFPRHARSFRSLDEWEGRQDSTASIQFEIINCSEKYFKFYGLQLVEGTLPASNSGKQVLINQTGMKAMKMDNPVGKTMLKGEGQLVIAGVVKDFYIAPPTIPAKPVMLEMGREFRSNYDEGVLFKYQEGSWPECKQRIEQLVKKLNPDITNCNIGNMEEEYARFLKSENALLLMLDFVTLVCVLISLFGVFSLVTLDCEQRRKEIAIRKVNGATTRHIMYKFFMKYMLLLLTATAVAFPVGYLIMKPWVENYVLQTSFDWWIYPAILLSLATLISLCTSWRIWKASNQNPAETIKSE